jgi:dethiobiotin synthetase
MKFFVTGTDTDIGKTIFSAMLVCGLEADYWKPVQSGLETPTDRETVEHLSQLPADHFHPEIYRLNAPLSPHRSAELDGDVIDPERLSIPTTKRPLVIEGAGGLMVPVNREFLLIDLLKKWQIPVILCARTQLGTINHSLLSVTALRERGIPIHGIAFIGDDMPDTIRTIADFSGVKILGRLPYLATLTKQTLQKAFADHFNPTDFLA